MTKAILITTGITVFVHDGAQPKMKYNRGKVVVSKKENSPYIFCVDKNEIKYV